jgi:hypothetical protein
MVACRCKGVWSLVSLLVLAVPLLAADRKDEKTTAEDVARQFRKTMEAAKSYSYDKKDEYQKKLQVSLDRIDRQIEIWKEKADQASGKARKEYARKVAELKRLRSRAQTQLERVKKATPGAWEDIKSGVSAAMSNLRQAFEKAASHFQKKEQ